VDLETFGSGATGALVPIHGTDPRRGPWEHRAFVPYGLLEATPELSALTHLAVANARAALAALDSTAKQLPNPRLLRHPTLRREAQSTSLLEGTYAPLSEVLMADDDAPQTHELREILNYVAMADQAFDWLEEGGQLAVALLCQLQLRLVRATPAEGSSSGDVRDIQVVVGQLSGASPMDLPVKSARFVPSPPGDDLRAHLQDLVSWMRVDRSECFDPVVAAAMSHYQFETIHPFHDGNGRLGRLLVAPR
jgi:Fic family protein